MFKKVLILKRYSKIDWHFGPCMASADENEQREAMPLPTPITTIKLGWPHSDLMIYQINEEWYFKTEIYSITKKPLLCVVKLSCVKILPQYKMCHNNDNVWPSVCSLSPPLSVLCLMVI